MGGGGHSTTHHTTKQENPYDDAWIRSKFGDVDKQALAFSNWQSGRQASLGREADIRSANEAAIRGLQTGGAAMGADIQNLKDYRASATADFAGLSGAQQQQMKDLYNLAQQEGSGVHGVRTGAGMTFVRPKMIGTGSLNRQQLQTGSLNI